MSFAYFLLYCILLQAQSDLIWSSVSSRIVKNMSQVSDNHIYKPPLPLPRPPVDWVPMPDPARINSRRQESPPAAAGSVPRSAPSPSEIIVPPPTLRPSSIPHKKDEGSSSDHLQDSDELLAARQALIPGRTRDRIHFPTPHGGYFCPRPPNIPNARSNLDTVRSPAFTLNTRAVYSCLNGYRNVSGTKELRCILSSNATKASWERPTLFCEIVNCFDPGFVQHSTRTGHSFTYKSNLTYTCDYGYRPNSAPFLICGSNGRWNREKPNCMLTTCPRLTPTDSATSYQYEDNTLRVNSSVKVKCPDGFHVKESVHRDAKCTWDGIYARWTNPLSHCIQTFCEPHHKHHSGLRILPKQIRYEIGAQVLMVCHTKSTVSAQCRKDGTWSRNTPYCPMPKKDRTCSALSKLEHGAHNSTEGPVKLGTRIAFKCDPKYVLHGPPWIFCKYDGQWTSKVPLCNLDPTGPDARIGTSPHRITLLLVSIILTLFLICFVLFIMGCRWKQRRSERKRWQRYFGNYNNRQSKTNIYHNQNQEMKLFKESKTPAVPVTDL